MSKRTAPREPTTKNAVVTGMRAGINGQQSSRTAGEIETTEPRSEAGARPAAQGARSIQGKRVSFYLVEGVGLIEVSPGVTSGC